MKGLVCEWWTIHGYPKITKTQRYEVLKLSLQHRMNTSLGDWNVQ